MSESNKKTSKKVNTSKKDSKKNGGKKLTKKQRAIRVEKVVEGVQEAMSGIGGERKTRIEAAVRYQLDKTLKSLSL